MRIHFIAIGGSAMHNLALALHHKGAKVSGSDDAIFEPSKSRLESAGLLPKAMGWFPEKITQEIDVVVLGMHAKADNPELAVAKKLGLHIVSYPEFLYEQSLDKTRVVIGGSHGKTTITAMLLHVLKKLDVEVDFMVGAQLSGYETMVHLTNQNEFMLMEGDEYLSSALDPRPKFHLYQPNIALLSGIAWDHINVFPTFDNYIEQFRIFIKTIMPGGILIYNEQDPVLQKLVEEVDHPIRKIGYSMPRFRVLEGQTFLDSEEGPIPLKMFGEHNLSNLSGARWVAQQMGVDAQEFNEAIMSFEGASKRLEKLYEAKDRLLLLDFAHAPSKVRATTKAAKTKFPSRKLVACLELHTYSSLNEKFLDQYQQSLDSADIAIVFYDPKAIALKGLQNLSADKISSAFNNENLMVFTNPKELAEYLAALDYANCTLLMMSSGNYGGLDKAVLTQNFSGVATP